MSEGAERHGAAVGGAHVKIGEVMRILLKTGLGLENDMVLVQLSKYRGHLALAEGIVKRVVERLRRNAKPGRGLAIDNQTRLQSLVLLVAGHVAQDGQRLQPFDKARHPHAEFPRVGVFKAVLKLGPAHTVFYREILYRLHEERDAFDLRKLGLEPANHVAGAGPAYLDRLQIDLDPAAIERRVRTVDPNEGRKARDGGIFQDHARQSLLPLGHGAE